MDGWVCDGRLRRGHAARFLRRREHELHLSQGGVSVPTSSSYSSIDKTQGWLALGGAPREQKMLEGPLPRVVYHQVYNVYKHK